MQEILNVPSHSITQVDVFFSHRSKLFDDKLLLAITSSSRVYPTLIGKMGKLYYTCLKFHILVTRTYMYVYVYVPICVYAYKKKKHTHIHTYSRKYIFVTKDTEGEHIYNLFHLVK